MSITQIIRTMAGCIRTENGGLRVTLLDRSAHDCIGEADKLAYGHPTTMPATVALNSYGH